ncbi:AAA family ATPase [Thioalkalivibrio sp. XN8]|uniref:AAA family ATPase n=1 Tax=Thioalkalivibrio sp. XN8 TaxID=2712863 RepID=UPI0013EAB0EA|nr:AAA family ATPase [Thioalkalivibrio sp. XN8]NGP52127.1 AAA family ATPase [Thioalkalivibrio sp. XN8]
MYLKLLSIHNYKSLRRIEFEPSRMACLIGANASGKSNFADALDFLSEVATVGLELAIARKGGYENIAFRRQRRSKAPLAFRVVIEASSKDLISMAEDPHPSSASVQIDHSFVFGTKGESITAPFQVETEQFEVKYREASTQQFRRIYRIDRDQAGAIKVSKGKKIPKHLKHESDFISLYGIESWQRIDASAQRLLVGPDRIIDSFTYAYNRALSETQVFRFSPDSTRSPGVPTPNARLRSLGENLPALVDWLQQNHPQQWHQVMAGMRDVLPTLREVSVDYSPSKTLILRFLENDTGRPWAAEDVSDGTIQSLAIFCAAADPRITILLIEEPENSVHPWVVRSLLDRFRDLSRAKTVILTTHSPTLIDRLEPSQVWICTRRNLETKLKRLTSYDAQIEADWRDGKYRLSEFLDSGLVPSAVPGGQD